MEGDGGMVCGRGCSQEHIIRRHDATVRDVKVQVADFISSVSPALFAGGFR